MKSVNAHFSIGSDKGEALDVKTALELIDFLDKHPKPKLGNFEIKGYDFNAKGGSDGNLTIALTPINIADSLKELTGGETPTVTNKVKAKKEGKQ